MRGATPKEHKALLKRIKDHLRLTREGRFTWSQRVMGDKTFLWKLESRGRMPFKKTLKKIDAAIKRKEASITSGKARDRLLTAQAKIKSGLRNGH